MNLQRSELGDTAAIEIIKDLKWKRGKISKVIPKKKIYKPWKLVVYEEQRSLETNPC